MKLLLIAALLLTPFTVSAEEDLVVNVKRLSLDTAMKIAQGAIEGCRAEGVQAGVTVVDRNGIEQVVLRDSLAPQITVPISKGKALAAVNFGVSTAQLSERANTPIGRVPGLVMATGGLVIQAAGSTLGAVGVSGAPSGEIDEQCAKAGIDKVLMDLEMM